MAYQEFPIIDKAGDEWRIEINPEDPERIRIGKWPKRPIKGQNGVTHYKTVDFVISAEVLSEIQKCMESGFKKEEWKVSIKEQLNNWLEDQVKRNADLRYGVRQEAPLILGYSIEKIKPLFVGDVETLKEVVQDLVAEGLIGIDTYNRIVIFKPEAFYKGWAI